MLHEKKHDLKSMTPSELERVVIEMGQPGYRAKQIFKWLHRGVERFDEMTDLSAAFRNQLRDACFISTLSIADRQISADGTKKFLFELPDGSRVESVLMDYRHGMSICISTQVGCRMGCAFCASTIGGLTRNLTTAELLDQIIYAQKDSERRISHVVLMGIGEPLDNFENVLRFLELVRLEDGLGIGHRHISLSTCGLCDKIDELAARKLQITLSISLHSPFDEVRQRLMPAAKKYGVAELLACCERYFKTTGRRISFEYTMMDQVNDREEDASELIRLFSGKNCHINLISLNHVAERAFSPSPNSRFDRFMSLLEAGGLRVTRRRSLGADISAACGQLRRENVSDEISG